MRRRSYHFSREDYCGPDFDPGTHFGTFGAAQDRWDQVGRPPGCLVEVRLYMSSPYRMEDQGQWLRPVEAYWDLTGDDKTGELVEYFGGEWPWDGDRYDQEDAVANVDAGLGFYPPGRGTLAQAWAIVYDELDHQGYDGIEYVNRVEDPGNLSYIIFDPGQVATLGVALLPPKVSDRWWGDPPFEDPWNLGK